MTDPEAIIPPQQESLELALTATAPRQYVADLTRRLLMGETTVRLGLKPTELQVTPLVPDTSDAVHNATGYIPAHKTDLGQTVPNPDKPSFTVPLNFERSSVLFIPKYGSSIAQGIDSHVQGSSDYPGVTYLSIALKSGTFVFGGTAGYEELDGLTRDADGNITLIGDLNLESQHLLSEKDAKAAQLSETDNRDRSKLMIASSKIIVHRTASLSTPEVTPVDSSQA